MLPTPVLAVALVVGLLCTGYGIWAVRESLRRDRFGRLRTVDEGPASRALRAPSWAITGRPDELRVLPDGRPVPVEWKSRAAPARGPLPSHRVQLLAYLALAEESTGQAPPYGILRYGDGPGFRIDWDARARAELSEWRSAIDAPYDGRADPSPGKCRRCRWRPICDARAL